MDPPVGKQVEVDSQWGGITKETAVCEQSQMAPRLWERTGLETPVSLGKAERGLR